MLMVGGETGLPDAKKPLQVMEKFLATASFRLLPPVSQH
jgi:hypothetical protein